MKKTLLIVSILLVAVVSTACINNFAVRDLNNKAAVFMQNGDYPQAIERLKSSLDLDPSVFETHYNLAVAYTNNEDYINAISEYEKAMEIKSDVADLYYSLATAQNNLYVDMKKGKVRLNPADDSLYKVKDDEISTDEEYKMSEKESAVSENMKAQALENYKKYLEFNPSPEDKEQTEKQMEKLLKSDEEIKNSSEVQQ